MINIEEFISKHVTLRQESYFKHDLEANHERLATEIAGKAVMVIGGAGSIGSSYIKALLRYGPARLCVIDVSENGLTELTRDLRSTYGMKVPEYYKAYPINFSDPIFDRILENEGPFDIVANFAAHKHVRSEKDQYSTAALIENNVLKAEQLLKTLSEVPPKHFFCVSTDKAANPVNIMGASKKMMEEVIMAYSVNFPITTARFANVAFSNGSLLDGFISRMTKRQPLSAPSDVKRYFVSPEESGQICLLACVLGASGDILYPRLSEDQMLTFSEIANHFLRFQGLEPKVCDSEEEAKRLAAERVESSKTYPVYYFQSDTSGEKACEEFVGQDEEVDLESFRVLGVIKNVPRKSLTNIDKMTAMLTQFLGQPSLTKNEIVGMLKTFLPSFSHIETGKNLDQKM
ncbi:MAG: polysaccharide biosynthesis protein [Planctomycetes bacterium]|nr:polysaccharide biosynthesis protein [Planctomycetota bacterium]